MDQLTQEKQEKSISEQLLGVLDTLTPNQLRFVVAMQEFNNKKEAAEAIGLQPNTVYGWNGNVNIALDLFRRERIEAARQIGIKYLTKAMMVKVNGLDSDDESVRQKAATEVIEWNLGQAGVNVDLTSGHVPLVFVRHEPAEN